MADNPNCPFCEEEYDATELFDDFTDGDERIEAKKVECGNCGRKFKIIQCIHVFYMTDPDKDFELYLDRHPETRELLKRLQADNESKLREYINAMDVSSNDESVRS